MDEQHLTGTLALYRIFKSVCDEDLEQYTDLEARGDIAIALDALADDIKATAARLRGGRVH